MPTIILITLILSGWLVGLIGLLIALYHKDCEDHLRAWIAHKERSWNQERDAYRATCKQQALRNVALNAELREARQALELALTQKHLTLPMRPAPTRVLSLETAAEAQGEPTLET